ncbi:hypothetical protein NM688_g6127 [Phlebia brevispora]|uniref:Uncharacterized protein n=1 Tax=Phlebia brevispora TaxID=194682 RepID=A0ACC1SJK2_9APHY|nr:hypothetical protein NM688_g6127 [Phlebia brevispora]
MPAPAAALTAIIPVATTLAILTLATLLLPIGLEHLVRRLDPRLAAEQAGTDTMITIYREDGTMSTESGKQ